LAPDRDAWALARPPDEGLDDGTEPEELGRGPLGDAAGAGFGAVGIGVGAAAGFGALAAGFRFTGACASSVDEPSGSGAKTFSGWTCIRPDSSSSAACSIISSSGIRYRSGDLPRFARKVRSASTPAASPFRPRSHRRDTYLSRKPETSSRAPQLTPEQNSQAGGSCAKGPAVFRAG
jgi:hypothetical protein